MPVACAMLRRSILAVLVWVSCSASQAGGSETENSVPPEPAEPPDLLTAFHEGPMAGVDELVFAVRQRGKDNHWYANFGYYSDSTLEKTNYPPHYAFGKRVTYGNGGRLCRLHLSTGQVAVLLNDPEGGVRDPVVDYDGRRIVFSYRPGGTEYYHLWAIEADGTDLEQLTDGPYDDVEPAFLPDARIVFISSRCKRWVQCWVTQVGVMHTCNADGSNIRQLSANLEHDNTPWPLPGGQILYTRWEYVDRSQVRFHHLWIASPDGTRQTVFFGNMHPNTTMIDAKPVPGSRKVVASFSPGHGRKEHAGAITLVDPRQGPDEWRSATSISEGVDYCDPWAFSEEAFLAVQGPRIVLMDGSGRQQAIYQLPQRDIEAGLHCHEPRPLVARDREPVLPPKVDWTTDTGCVLLLNVYQGRNMTGVERGDVKKLLILEPLPKPINFTGGMEPLSYGGTFTLERVMGTVPVESDGSAYFEMPALRSFFFVALDENDLAVKRMQSFMTLMPGEKSTCIGCHEQRSLSPQYQPGEYLAARRRPSRIEPIPHVPDVFDYPRDIQPILDRHCVACHDNDRREGGVVLTGDRGPIFSISYYTMIAKNLVADGRNGLANRAPRTIGSSASRLMTLIDGSHYDVKVSGRERDLIRLWIETGAPYPGTYAALGCGMIGGYYENQLDRSDTEWPSMIASMEALTRRCTRCHKGPTALPLSPSDNVGGPPWVALEPDDPRRTWSRHLLYNLAQPDKSLILLAPLAREASGLGLCSEAIFADTSDPDYRKVLLAIEETKQKLDRIKRFDMPGFRPRKQYVRELKRYGVLPADLPADEPIDVYTADRAYWKSLWHRGSR